MVNYLIAAKCTYKFLARVTSFSTGEIFFLPSVNIQNKNVEGRSHSSDCVLKKKTFVNMSEQIHVGKFILLQ